MNGAGFSYQPNIIGKPDKQTLAENYQVKGWLSNGFRYNKGGLDELIQTSTIDGNLWTGAVLQNGGHRHGSKFNAASFIGLDIDNEVNKTPLPLEEQILPEHLLEHPILKDQVAFGYHSPSHKAGVVNKFRLVLRLPEPIRDRGEYRLITQKLWALLPGLDDCCDEVRLWFGVTTGTIHRDDSAVLDLNRLNSAFDVLDEETKDQAIKKALNPTLTLEERIERGWVSPGSAADTDAEVDKEILSLLLPHLPVAAESGSYNAIRPTLSAVADRWGAEEATAILDELGYYWPRERPLYDTLKDLDRETGCNYRFGSLIHDVQKLTSWKNEPLNEERLSRLQSKAFNGPELTTTEDIAKAFGTTEGFTVTNYTPPTPEEEASSTTQRIEELFELLFEEELQIQQNNYARKQTIEIQLTRLGVRREDIRARIFDMVCAYLGADLKNTKGTSIKSKSGLDLLKNRQRAKLDHFIEGLLIKNKDHILYGDAGTGKTLLSLFMAKALVFGGMVGDTQQVKPTKGRILYIGSDSGAANESILQLYLDQMGLLEENRREFLERFDFKSADEEAGSAQWNFNTHNLIWLKQTLAEQDYDLVIIDSLKAVTANTRYSIDERNIGDIMRLMQNIVLPHSTLIWVHHANKSTSRSTHRAGGCTDIVETVSAAIEMEKVVHDKNGVEPEYWCRVQKMRGSSHREFQLDFDWERGLTKKDEYSIESVVQEFTKRKTDVPGCILVHLSEMQYGRGSAASFASNYPEIAPHRTQIGRHLTELCEKGLIKDTSAKKRGTYQITSEGKKAAESYRAQNPDLFDF